MARSTYLPDSIGGEVVAPSGYYQPVQEQIIDHRGRRLLYTVGTACIEASCCGVGSWSYLRVEGYVVDDGPALGRGEAKLVEIDTIEDESAKSAIARFLLEQHPGVRVEFR